MDAETAAKELTQLEKALAAALIALDSALGLLPAPLNLPVETSDTSLILDAMTLAWDLAGQEGLSSVTLARVREIITAWTSAREIAMIANLRGPAPWRLRAIEDAITRIEAGAAAITRHMQGDFRSEQLTPDERAEVVEWVASSTRLHRRPRL